MITTENSNSEQLGELFFALAKAQGKIEHALKDKKNPFFKSSYADLTSVWEACREPLSSNGLAVVQTIEGSKEAMFLITWLGHSSGQWIKSKLPLFIMKQDPQSVGSSITYARRYSLSALVGICADEDDDGEKAMGRKNVPEKQEVDPKEEENRYTEILSKFSKEDHKYVMDYIKLMSELYKLASVDFIKKALSNIEKFTDSFNTWKLKSIAES